MHSENGSGRQMHQMALGVQMGNPQRVNADHLVSGRQAGQFVVGEYSLHGQ